MTQESERDFGVITLLFSVTPLSDVQLENIGVKLSEFHSDSCVITNSYFVGHSWVGLEPIIFYRHIYGHGI
jgi:hypothetical protein